MTKFIVIDIVVCFATSNPENHDGYVNPIAISQTSELLTSLFGNHHTVCYVIKLARKVELLKVVDEGYQFNAYREEMNCSKRYILNKDIQDIIIDISRKNKITYKKCKISNIIYNSAHIRENSEFIEKGPKMTDRKGYQKEYRKAHKEELKEYQKEYRKAQKNSLGQTKASIRTKSNWYLRKNGQKIAGFEIHHVCSYSEPYKFIYCSKEMHRLIHAYLRENNIDADTDHYERIRHLLDDTVVLYGID